MLVIAIYLGVNEACETYIKIKNNLGPGKILRYHCRSINKDLGVQHLNFGATRTIPLKNQGVNAKTWKCLLKHGFNMRYYRDIDAYSGNPYMRCRVPRIWTAEDRRIYFLDMEGNRGGRWSGET